MPDVRNLATVLVLILLGAGLYAGNTEFREHRVEVVMRQRERIEDKWLKEDAYLKELETISVDYCPAEFRTAWRTYLDLLRDDVSPAGQAKKAAAIAQGQKTDQVNDYLRTLIWVANGYGFVPHKK